MTGVYDVIVIGCGASGIAALSHLAKENLKVLGLEGSSKLGGRISTVNFADNVVDLGAQWCHTEKNNAVFTLVKDLNVIHPNSSKKLVFLMSNGDRLFETDFEKYLQICSTITNNIRKNTDHSKESLYSYIQNEYSKNINSANFPVNNDTSHQLLEWYLKSVQAKIKVNELMEKSVNSVRESWDNDGEQWYNWKDRGYGTIIDILMQKYPDSSKILPINVEYNKEVINIKWNIQKDSPNNLIQVLCRDSSLYITKHVIITMSLGVLKERYETLFTPSIPDDKIFSIKSLAMCTMNKIYMRFTERWWTEKYVGFGIIWKEEDISEFNGEEDWLTGIYEISTVENQPNLLCAWVVGTTAENMELCSTEDILNGFYKLLQRFFTPHYNVKIPCEILRSTWYTNSLTRGAFSYRSVEAEYVNKGALTLSEPLINESGKPLICFAGEATSLHHHSTVHGAVESGIREANRLISLLKNKTD